jgi:hypothetical protein
MKNLQIETPTNKASGQFMEAVSISPSGGNEPLTTIQLRSPNHRIRTAVHLWVRGGLLNHASLVERGVPDGGALCCLL